MFSDYSKLNLERDFKSYKNRKKLAQITDYLHNTQYKFS